jgi:AcrR family transcriptional regulator
MPKISEPTVAEHHAKQRAAILDAARRRILSQGSSAFTIGEVASDVRLTRSAIYEYFGSRDDLIVGLCEEELPKWADQVRSAMDAARTPRRRVLAFVLTQLELIAAGEHRIAALLSDIELGPRAARRVRDLHGELIPLVIDALAATGDAEPPVTAELLQGIVNAGARRIEREGDATAVIDAARRLVSRA